MPKSYKETQFLMDTIIEEGKDINWPDNALIVSIRRREQELISQGNTRLLAGDYLYILAEQGKAEIQALAGDKK